MDAITGFLTRLLASTGLGVNKDVTVIAAFVLAVIIVAVVLALRRRSDRLAERFDGPHPRHATDEEAEPHVVPVREAVQDALADLEQAKQQLEGANRPESKPSGDLARLASDLAIMRETIGKTVATNVASAKAEPLTAQQSVQDYQGRIELLQATLTSLQSEQLTLRRLLETCNSGLQSIEQFVAAVPSIRTEHASIKQQLAELNARFDAASEVLTDLLQSEDLPKDH
jgi:chromosome segregation ATPase